MIKQWIKNWLEIKDPVDQEQARIMKGDYEDFKETLYQFRVDYNKFN